MPKRILIVEDEDATAKVMQICLNKGGFEVMRATNGMEGYDMARKERPDLILLDMMLPKMDGMKVARLLRHDRAHNGIPIIFATAGAPEMAEEAVEQNLAEAYLSKPFEYDHLIETVQRILEVWTAE